jgi:hypothetical protein
MSRCWNQINSKSYLVWLWKFSRNFQIDQMSSSRITLPIHNWLVKRNRRFIVNKLFMLFCQYPEAALLDNKSDHWARRVQKTLWDINKMKQHCCKSLFTDSIKTKGNIMDNCMNPEKREIESAKFHWTIQIIIWIAPRIHWETCVFNQTQSSRSNENRRFPSEATSPVLLADLGMVEWHDFKWIYLMCTCVSNWNTFVLLIRLTKSDDSLNWEWFNSIRSRSGQNNARLLSFLSLSGSDRFFQNRWWVWTWIWVSNCNAIYNHQVCQEKCELSWKWLE